MSEGRISESPLFDKMDALMRRHRSSHAGHDIPVLHEEAQGEIPVLTDALATAGLMFDPRDFAAPHTPLPPFFLQPGEDLPPAFADPAELELEAQPVSPVPASGHGRDPLEWAVDRGEPISLARPQPAASPAPLPALEVEEIHFPVLELGADEDWDDAAIPVLSHEVLSSSAEEAIPLLPASAFAAEPVTVVELSDADLVAPEMAVPPVAAATLPAAAVTPPPTPTPIRVPAPRVAEVRPQVLAQPEVARAPAVVPPPPCKEELTLTELPQEMAPQVLMLESQSAPLKAESVAEITAAVAAQISVEINTEVAQLTRQHFASMMNSFYSDSLRRLTEEISRDLEDRLSVRIAALVEAELRRQGQLD